MNTQLLKPVNFIVVASMALITYMFVQKLTKKDTE